MSCDVHHAQIHEAEIGLFGGQVLCRDPGYRQVAQGVFKVPSEVGEIEGTRCCQVAELLPIVDERRFPSHGVSRFNDARHRAHQRNPCVGGDAVP